ncbi:MAG: hypothetical protein Mars2KO_45900 [Maribacter sp.]
MSGVSNALRKTIKELQDIPSLENFALGGGTNLALRYNHRDSIDIDLFCSETIGIDGFNKIANEVQEFYKGKISGLDFPCKIDNQYIFLRFFVHQEETFIKVEVLQNFQRLDEIEIVDDFKLLTRQDVGLLKLMSGSNRASKKDIYDLDYITDEIPLSSLYSALKQKEEKYLEESYKTIFDLDKEESPIDKIELLIEFDAPKKTSSSRPNHSNDRIDTIEGSKTWKEARYNWLRKVRSLYRELDISYPKPKGLDIS